MGESGDEKKAAKQLMSSGNDKAAGIWRPAGRRRSFSTPAETVGCSSGHAAAAAAALLSRSCSTSADAGEKKKRQQAPGGGGGVGARLSRKVKEQRARLYIVRRCVYMLLCWRDTDHN